MMPEKKWLKKDGACQKETGANLKELTMTKLKQSEQQNK